MSGTRHVFSTSSAICRELLLLCRSECPERKGMHDRASGGRVFPQEQAIGVQFHALCMVRCASGFGADSPRTRHGLCPRG